MCWLFKNLLQRLECSDTKTNQISEQNQPDTTLSKPDTNNKPNSTPVDVKLSKDSATFSCKAVKSESNQSKVELKNSESKQVSALIRNIENESKTSIKLEKSMRGSEWDMFADQDNFDSVDVSVCNHFFLLQ